MSCQTPELGLSCLDPLKKDYLGFSLDPDILQQITGLGRNGGRLKEENSKVENRVAPQRLVKPHMNIHWILFILPWVS
jgi:hypothetical protein